MSPLVGRVAAEKRGYRIYTVTGHMCYVSMNPNRPRWKSEAAPTPEEALSAITGLGAYCAAVEIHAKEGFVIHHVEIERSPNFVGRARKRWFTFKGRSCVLADRYSGTHLARERVEK